MTSDTHRTQTPTATSDGRAPEPAQADLQYPGQADLQYEVDLAISGMTCASCVARVERKLGKLDGVEAQVNLATEKARVRFAAPITVEDLLATARSTGYGAQVAAAPRPVDAEIRRPGAKPADQTGPVAHATDAQTLPAHGATGPAHGAAARPAQGDDAAYAHAESASATSPAHRDDATYAQAERASATGPAHGDHLGTTSGGRDTTGTGAATDHLDHDAAPAQVLRRRALISSVLSLPVLLLAMVPWFADIPGNAWIQLALTTPVVLWCAWPFHRAAAINARHLASTMDTLVSVGVLAAYLWSAVAVLTGRAASGMSGMSGETESAHLYFETAAVVTTFLLVGRWLEARAKHQGKSALTTLLSLGAKDVAVLRPDDATGRAEEVRVPIEDLAVGMRFVVRPGEKVATDGRVLDGSSTVDNSLVTGESVPVDVSAGADVIGGTINGAGRLVVEATRVGAETTLAGIGRLVENAQTGKAGVERLADRISAVFVPIVLALASLTFLGWWIGTGSVSQALGVAIAVLIIACPCALGLATPTAILVGTGRGAQLGILITGPQVLEDTRNVDTIVLDKTGTVTTGKPTLLHIATHGRLSEESALRAAAAVEAGSEHPIALAIAGAARERSLEVPEATDFRALTGDGATARVNGQQVTVGRASLFTVVPDDLPAAQAGSTVWVGWDGVAHASLTVADSVRPDAAAALRALEGLGLTPYLLTGDQPAPAHAVAAQVGIPADRVVAGVHPADKHAMIQRLQAEGKVVAMVGDGVNDAAALAAADLGIAMGGGTDVAAASADLLLMRDRVGDVATGIGLSRETLRIIKQNLVWAFGYNTAAIPLAMAGLLNPMIAGAAMAASSVLVVTNSLRLRRYARQAS